MRLAVLFLTSLLCLTCLAACQNNAPANQLTVVQGTVSSADTGRPLPGVLLAVLSFSHQPNGYATDEQLTGDSVRTDAQGNYELSFRNAKGRYYAVSFSPMVPGKPYAPRYALYSHPTNATSPSSIPDTQDLTLGQTNNKDFVADERALVAIRIRNRNTRYRWLEFNHLYFNGSRLDTLAYLYTYYPAQPATKLAFRYFNYNPASPYAQLLNDTVVAVRVQNPAARYPDTLCATLTFVH